MSWIDESDLIHKDRYQAARADEFVWRRARELGHPGPGDGRSRTHPAG